ncbi:MAG: UvrD-helicase domain-containing protein [Planctomycetota bacterium]
MRAPKHLLVRASAGTGKTHELSSRYLALLLDGVDADRILATTFTRKAAQEILDRILSRLARAAADTDSGRKILAELTESMGRQVRAPECSTALEKLVRGMDRIRIGTIDSFFAQLARLFALDLGLPAGWRIADEVESELLRSEAVADAVAGAGKLELLDLLRDFQQQSVGQGAHGVLLRFVEQGREVLLESTPQAWNRIGVLPDVEPRVLEAAIEAWPRFPVPKTTKGKDWTSWVKAKDKVSRYVEQRDWAGLLEVTLVKNVAAKVGKYDKCLIGAEHLEFLSPLVAHALHLRTSMLVLQNRAARDLLERYERSYQSTARARGLLRFEDIPNALTTLSGEDPLAQRGIEIAHRIDGRIDHLLLDEFQDTAPVQWRVLRPLAEGILADSSGERSFFCVGDPKQSIYGWRAAEPRLLRCLHQDRPMLVPKPLDDSYRSSHAVLGAVNLVFGTIAQNPAFGESGAEVIAAAEEMQSTFREHKPARSKPGAVFLVRTRERESEEGAHVPASEAAVERVSSILTEAPRATVGVLVRVRKRIPDLIRRLRDRGILASDEGGNPLTDSAAVLHALSLLHLADHPGDTAAAFHVAKSPLGRLVGLEPEALFAGRSRGESRDGKLADPIVVRAGAVAREVRAKIAALGFGGYLASIRPSVGYGDWDLGRFGQLIDLALAWESRAGSRPSAFVEHVRKTKVEDRSAGQVKVMTVHAAKGLEFDAVVLPDLDSRMRHAGESLLSMRPRPEGAIEVVSHGIGKSISPALPELELVRQDVVRRDMVEELCVMYVAMTRAIHRLDLIVPWRKEHGTGLTNAAILRRTFDVDAAGPAGVAWSHPENTTPWFREEIGPAAKEESSSTTEEAASATREAPAVAATAPALRLDSPRRARSTASRSPSLAKDLDLVSPSRLLRPRDAMTARGRIVHRLLEEVEWIDDFDRSDEDLLALARSLEADSELVASVLAEFRASLERPGTKRLLSRPAHETEVWRERPFSLLLPDAHGLETLWTGAFDRVVLRREGGTVVSAEIIDFKTDRVNGESLRARVESYRQQMQAYRRALAHITGLTEAAIRLRLAFLAPDAIEDL